MNTIYKKIFFKFLLILFLFTTFSFGNSSIIEKITIKGNERISNETIILFSPVEINQNITNDRLNEILKNIYDTNFFKEVSVNLILYYQLLVLLFVALP